MSRVTSPPSSTTSCGPLPPGWLTASSVQSQYSSSVSPFQAKTGTPVLAMAAAALSWVEKMLQLAQRTEAPSATRVSISTAVWIVMCSEPVMRTPLSGLAAAYFARMDMRPGISCSATAISLRPHSASERSLTLKSCLAAPLPFLAARRFLGALGSLTVAIFVSGFVSCLNYRTAFLSAAALSVFSQVMLLRSSTLPKWP